MSNIKDTAKGLYDSLQMSLATMDPGTAKVLGGAAGGLAGGAVGAIGGRRGRVGRMIALGLLGTAAGTAVGGELPRAAVGGLSSAATAAGERRRDFFRSFNLLRSLGRAGSKAAAGGLNLAAYPSDAEYKLAEAQGKLLKASDLPPPKLWRSMESALEWPIGLLDWLSSEARQRVESR